MSEIKPVAEIIAHYYGNEYAVAFVSKPEMDGRLYSHSQFAALQAELAAQQKKIAGLDSVCLMHEKTAQELIEHAKKLEAELAALKEAQRWIPVSERLPEDCVTVIALNDYYKSAPVGPARYCHDGERWQDLECVDRDGDWQETPNVTHWMPLPSPPVGQEG